jgi:predicted Zn-dependent protease
MHRLLRVAVLGVVPALAAGLGFPTHMQAGVGEEEKQKVTELMKAQILLSEGEHQKYYEALEKLVAKYPNDADLKGLLDAHHETMHERMEAEKKLREELIRSGVAAAPNSVS